MLKGKSPFKITAVIVKKSPCISKYSECSQDIRPAVSEETNSNRYAELILAPFFS
jgi:hypothetical protein